jgi:phage protein U
MLACLGPVVFDIRVDLQSISETEKSSFAKHEILGGSPIYEPVGEEEGKITLKGTLLPYFLGGLNGLAAIHQARLQKLPLPLMRGDFQPRSWVLIDSITREDTELDAGEGIGHSIEYTVELIKVGTPDISSAASILRLFL